MVASLWQQNSIKGLLPILMALVAIIWVREKSCLWKLNELMLFKMTQTSQHKKMSYTSSMFRFHLRARRVAKCWQPGPVCCVHQCPDCPACSTSTEYLMSLPPAILIILCRWDEKRWFQSFQWENFISYIPQSAGLTNIQGFPYPPQQHKWLC